MPVSPPLPYPIEVSPQVQHTLVNCRARPDVRIDPRSAKLEVHATVLGGTGASVRGASRRYGSGPALFQPFQAELGLDWRKHCRIAARFAGLRRPAGAGSRGPAGRIPAAVAARGRRTQI